MGSFGEYLESLKYTPEYAMAKGQDRLSDKLYILMISKGITEKDLAQKSGLSESTIDEALGGWGLSLNALYRIADALDYAVKIELMPKERAGE